MIDMSRGCVREGLQLAVIDVISNLHVPTFINLAALMCLFRLFSPAIQAAQTSRNVGHDFGLGRNSKPGLWAVLESACL